jgi:hypothetical protein
VAFAFETGEIWSIDTLLLSTDPSKIYLEETMKLYAERLEDYGRYLQKLGILPPYHWIGGLEGVKGRRLAIPPPAGYTSIFPGQECLASIISEEGTYDLQQPPTTALRKLFELICRKCGEPYPEHAPFL